MDISEFMSIVSEVKENKPILFGLESDREASDNEIEQIEEYMCIFNHDEQQVIEETIDNLFQALVKYGFKL